MIHASRTQRDWIQQHLEREISKQNKIARRYLEERVRQKSFRTLAALSPGHQISRPDCSANHGSSWLISPATTKG